MQCFWRLYVRAREEVSENEHGGGYEDEIKAEIGSKSHEGRL